MQRPLPDSTRHSQGTKFHAAEGIRIPNLNKRAAVDLHIRQLCHWDRLMMMMIMMMTAVSPFRSRFSVYCCRLACSLYSQYALR